MTGPQSMLGDNGKPRTNSDSSFIKQDQHLSHMSSEDLRRGRISSARLAQKFGFPSAFLHKRERERDEVASIVN